MMKTKEEILNEFGCPDIPFDENVTMYYPAILSAMEEYAQQQLKILNIPAVSKWVAIKDELPPVEIDVLVWDEFSIYISNRLDVEGIVWDESIHILDNVTYWMYLPKPPCC